MRAFQSVIFVRQKKDVSAFAYRKRILQRLKSLEIAAYLWGNFSALIIFSSM